MYRCPVCGRPTDYREELHGLCPECFIKKYGERINLGQQDVVTIIICPSCGRVKFGKGWYKFTREILVKIISQKIRNNWKIRGYALEIEVTDEKIDELKKLNNVEIDVWLLKNKLKMKQITVKVSLQRKVCPLCMRKIEGKYFEYIIHVRSKNWSKERMKKVINKINSVTDRYQGNEIVDIKRSSNGLDIRVSDRRLGEKISNAISIDAIFRDERKEKRYDKGLQKLITVRKVLIEI